MKTTAKVTRSVPKKRVELVRGSASEIIKAIGASKREAREAAKAVAHAMRTTTGPKVKVARKATAKPLRRATTAK